MDVTSRMLQLLFEGKFEQVLVNFLLLMEQVKRDRLCLSINAFEKECWHGRLRSIAHLLAVWCKSNPQDLARLQATESFELFRTIIWENEADKALFHALNVPGREPPARTPLTSDAV